MQNKRPPHRRSSIHALAAVILAAAVGSGAVFCTKKQTWHTVYCSAVLPFTTWTPRAAGLLECSNVTQGPGKSGPENIEDQQQEGVSDWKTFTTADKSREGSFRVRVKRDRAFVMFYPRVNGGDSGVEVFEISGTDRRKLFDLKGQDGIWSPIGQRYEINLGCTMVGFAPEEEDVELEFVLKGPWAQIWHKAEAVFF